jgi:hypothetical protein
MKREKKLCWRPPRWWRPAALALAIAIASLLAPGGLCQGATCAVTYYTVTSTIFQTLTQVRTEEITSTTYTTYVGADGSTTISPVSWTTTTTRTYVEVQTLVTPGGVLANISCSWPTPTLTPKPPAGGPGLGGYPRDFFSMMMAGAALGIMALGLVYTVSRAIIYLAGGALAVSLLAAAYPPLSSLAAAYVVIAVMIAIVLAWMVRKREE